MMIHSRSLLASATVIALSALLPGQAESGTPGSFSARVIWERNAPAARSFQAIDDDGDGSPALWIASPSTATLFRYDENGARTDIRGATGVQFAHHFGVGDVFPNHAGQEVVIAADSGQPTLSFTDTNGLGIGAPLITTPVWMTDIRALSLGNFDADPESEVALVGNYGWGYYDGATQSITTVLSGIPTANRLLGNPLVRKNASGPDSLVIPAAGSPTGSLDEFDVNGNRTTIAPLPAGAQTVDATAWVQDKIVFSVSNGSFTTPSGAIHSVDPLTGQSQLSHQGQPADSFPRISGPIVTKKEWFFVKKSFGGNEEVYGVDGIGGIPQLRIQAPAGTGLNIGIEGEKYLFPGNTRHLLVHQAITQRIYAYSTEGDVDTKVVTPYAVSGGNLKVDFNLGASRAGAQIYTLASFAAPTATQLPPAFGPISFTFDALTSLWLQGVPPLTADGNGQATLDFPIPSTGTFGRFDFSLGYISVNPDNTLSANQTGSLTYIDFQ